MRTLAAEEHESLSKAAFEIIESTFPTLLIPASTTSHLSALMELKSAVGGSDAKLFLADLLRMYLRLANGRHWKATVVAQSGAECGGIKDALVEIKGAGAYDSLHWESGVHRVQRIPITDAAGRVHTSTIAVIVRCSTTATHECITQP
jgi:peptide chain release factor 1